MQSVYPMRVLLDLNVVLSQAASVLLFDYNDRRGVKPGVGLNKEKY